MSFQMEPAIWIGLAEAVIILLVAFGVPISNEQKVAVIGVLTAVLVVVGSIVTRFFVTPTAKLKKEEEEPPAEVAPVA